MSTYPGLAVEDAVSAADLATAMLKPEASYESVLKELQISQEQLQQLLYSSKTHEHIQARIGFTALRIKLLSIQSAPSAFDQLHQLIFAQKPEVARRAAVTLLEVAGVSTATAHQQPVAPTLEKPAPEPQNHKPAAVISYINNLFPFTAEQILQLIKHKIPSYMPIVFDENVRAMKKHLTDEQYGILHAALIDDEPLPVIPKPKPDAKPHPKQTPEEVHQYLKKRHADRDRRIRDKKAKRQAQWRPTHAPTNPTTNPNAKPPSPNGSPAPTPAPTHPTPPATPPTNHQPPTTPNPTTAPPY